MIANYRTEENEEQSRKRGGDTNVNFPIYVRTMQVVA